MPAESSPSRRSSGSTTGDMASDDSYQYRPASNRRQRISIGDEEPPLYRIDLSLPPESRYTEISNAYKDEIHELTGIYGELLRLTPSPSFFGFLAKLLLRRVYSDEETKEIEGIVKTARVPKDLVVAYNTFLDLFSGCVSGGVKVKVPGLRGTRMMHFRGLDWEMDPLRDMIIRVEYILGGNVVARGVTYAGYIGVLTGVREGLSMAFNYRARFHSESTAFQNRLHHILLLLGKRPTVASRLRQILLTPGPVPALEDLANEFRHTKGSSCYLTFCTPSEVLVVEKDLNSAVTNTSNQFFAVTNHDQAMEAWTHEKWLETLKSLTGFTGARDIMEESMERKECLYDLWRLKGVDTVTVDDLKYWLRKEPIRNKDTHFSCIMDPSVPGGGLVWVETSEL